MSGPKILIVALVATLALSGCSQASDSGSDPATSTVTETPATAPEPVDMAACQEAVTLLHEALVQRHEDLLLFLVELPTSPLEDLPEVIEQAETLEQVNARIDDANAALADCPGSEPLDLIQAGDTSIPTPEPEPEPEPAEQVTAADFEVTLFVTNNECFNSAGSSVEFEPELAVDDPDNFPAVSGTLVFEVQAGDENLGTFSIEFADDGTYNYNEERVSPDECYDDSDFVADVVRVRSR